MIHYCTRTEHGPDQADTYIAICGYQSENEEEFKTDSLAKVTCEECLQRYAIHD